MTTRTTSRNIKFARPFLLNGFASEHPAGTYVIDTEEERGESLSFLVWKRVSTVIRLEVGGATEYLSVDPIELDDALTKDASYGETASRSLLPRRSTLNVNRLRDRMEMATHRIGHP